MFLQMQMFSSHSTFFFQSLGLKLNFFSCFLMSDEEFPLQIHLLDHWNMQALASQVFLCCFFETIIATVASMCVLTKTA